MKSTHHIVVLLLLVILNSCEIAQKPHHTQVQKLFAAQQLPKQEAPDSCEEKTICKHQPYQMAWSHDSITKPVSENHISGNKVLAQKHKFKIFSRSAINVPVAKMNRVGLSMIRLHSAAAGFSKSANVQTNIKFKLAAISFAIALLLIIILVADIDAITLAFLGLIGLLAIIFLFIGLLFFAMFLSHLKKKFRKE